MKCWKVRSERALVNKGTGIGEANRGMEVCCELEKAEEGVGYIKG